MAQNRGDKVHKVKAHYIDITKKNMCPSPEVCNASRTGSSTEGDDEWDDANRMIIRAKWTMDSAKTVDECIERLQGFIKYLSELKEEGWELDNPVDDDYGFLRKRSSATPTATNNT